VICEVVWCDWQIDNQLTETENNIYRLAPGDAEASAVRGSPLHLMGKMKYHIS